MRQPPSEHPLAWDSVFVYPQSLFDTVAKPEMSLRTSLLAHLEQTMLSSGVDAKTSLLNFLPQELHS